MTMEIKTLEVCDVCGEPTLKAIPRPDGLYMNIHVSCKCERDAKSAEEAESSRAQREVETSRRKHSCFHDADMLTWNFSNDDGAEPNNTRVAKAYCEKFAKFRANGQGLLLFSSVGTGKSFLAACIANELIDNGYSVKMTSLVDICDELTGTFDKAQVMDKLKSYDLLIIDDLGVERDTPTVRERVFSIVDSRYKAKKPIVFTTNLSGKELREPDSMTCARIYDRILERCHPYEVTGSNRRKANFKRNYDTMKEELGL